MSYDLVFPIFAMKNNYSDIMIQRANNISNVNLAASSFDMGVERTLFLSHGFYCAKLFMNKEKLFVLDYGGGIGLQALYLKNTFRDQVDVIVLEQEKICKKITDSNIGETLERNRIKFITEINESQKNKIDIVYFNGSLSYIEKPLDLLGSEIFSRSLKCVSRLPVLISPQKKSLIYKDPLGGHEELILSEGMLQAHLQALNSTIFFAEKYKLPERKSYIDGNHVASLDLIFV